MQFWLMIHNRLSCLQESVSWKDKLGMGDVRRQRTMNFDYFANYKKIGWDILEYVDHRKEEGIL